MSEHTGIAWTDHTWNPWQGCHKVSAGCNNCYMYREKERFGQDPGTVIRSKPATFNAPLKWKEPARVFTCSWSDFFIEEADEWRCEAWEIIRRTPHLTYQILTKRIERAEFLVPDDPVLPNVWIGATVENEWAAEERIAELLATPAVKRFVSCEPLIGFVDLTPWLGIAWQCSGCREYFPDPWQKTCPSCGREDYWTGSHKFNPPQRPADHTIRQRGPGIDWVIAGCESGPFARPMKTEWVRSLRDQCRAAGVPFFFKQAMVDGKLDHCPTLDGVEHREFPS